MGNAEDEVARAAAKHRAREAAERDGAARGAVVDLDAKQVEHRKSLLARALGGEVGGRLTVIIIGVVVVVGILGAALVLRRVHGDGAMLGAAFGSAAVIMGLSIGLPFAIPALLAARRRARLGRIGHGFDEAAYVELLCQNRRTGRLVVTLRFASAPEAAKRGELADAVRGWMPELASAEWDGDALRMTSGELEGITVIGATKYGGGGRDWSNASFHTCFGHVLHRVVHTLDRIRPVSRLEVASDGTVEAWDAKA